MRYTFIIALSTVLVRTAFAATPAEVVQAKLHAIRTMQADFKQVITAGKRELSTSSGWMALSRPECFRWQTNAPMQQLVVADSKQLWVYDKDLDQVTVKRQEKGIRGTPGLFLSGDDKAVNRDFEVVAIHQGSSELYDLHARSNKENFQRVKLTFNGDVLRVIEFFDQLGQHTFIHLSHVKNNLPLAKNMFIFHVPKGVDLIEQ